MNVIVVHTSSGYWGKGDSLSEAMRKANAQIYDDLVITIIEAESKDDVKVGDGISYKGEKKTQLGPESLRHAFTNRSIFDKVVNMLFERGHADLADRLEDVLDEE